MPHRVPRCGAASASVGSKSSPKRPSGRSAIDAGGGRRGRTRTENAGESLVPARQRPPQFPLRPYISPQIEEFRHERWRSERVYAVWAAADECGGREVKPREIPPVGGGGSL